MRIQFTLKSKAKPTPAPNPTINYLYKIGWAKTDIANHLIDTGLSKFSFQHTFLRITAMEHAEGPGFPLQRASFLQLATIFNGRHHGLSKQENSVVKSYLDECLTINSSPDISQITRLDEIAIFWIMVLACCRWTRKRIGEEFNTSTSAITYHTRNLEPWTFAELPMLFPPALLDIDVAQSSQLDHADHADRNIQQAANI